MTYLSTGYFLKFHVFYYTRELVVSFFVFLRKMKHPISTSFPSVCNREIHHACLCVVLLHLIPILIFLAQFHGKRCSTGAFLGESAYCLYVGGQEINTVQIVEDCTLSFEQRILLDGFSKIHIVIIAIDLASTTKPSNAGVISNCDIQSSLLNVSLPWQRNLNSIIGE